MGQISWTDDRDGKTWAVYNYNAVPAMGGTGHASKTDPGEERVGFRHPDYHEPSEGYSTANPDGRRGEDMDDETLKRLLDRARSEEEAGG